MSGCNRQPETVTMMQLSKTTTIFVAVATIYTLLACILLYWFFGPWGSALHLIAITEPLLLLILPITAAISSWIFSKRLDGKWAITSRDISARRCTIQGAYIGSMTFLCCALMYVAIATFSTSLEELSTWVVATVVYGGLFLGFPGVIISATTGYLIARCYNLNR